MRRLLPFVAAVVAVAITTLVIAVAVGRTELASISMLYLVAVLVVAVLFGRGAAIAASVLAFLTFDWFFVPPTHQLVVADPDELFALALFLLTAIVTGTLAARERARADEARQREREATVLYEAAFLMAEPHLERAVGGVAEHLRAALDLDALAIEADTEVLPRAAVAARNEASRDALRAAGTELRVMEPHRPSRRIRLIGPRAGGPGRRIRIFPITGSAARLGRVLVLTRPQASELRPSDERLLAIAAAQLGVTIERARFRQEALEGEVARRADDLKTELLHAVSHELRTPLASILASAGSLRQRDVAWTERERDVFVSAIQEEALRLDRVVGNLLDLSRIENGTLCHTKRGMTWARSWRTSPEGSGRSPPGTWCASRSPTTCPRSSSTMCRDSTGPRKPLTGVFSRRLGPGSVH